MVLELARIGFDPVGHILMLSGRRQLQLGVDHLTMIFRQNNR